MVSDDQRTIKTLPFTVLTDILQDCHLHTGTVVELQQCKLESVWLGLKQSIISQSIFSTPIT